MILPRSSRLFLLLIVLLLGACSRAPVLPATDLPGTPATSTSTEPTTPAPEGTTGPGDEPGSTATAPSSGGPVTLRIWLPPQFAPDPATEAGILLDDRLDEFALLHPGIRITVRVKDERGAGGMVSSLAATADAVPNARPDLILMPRLEMERAVENELLLPFDQPLEPEWYDFARTLAMTDGTVYGRPFAADALVLLFRSSVITDPPRDWTTTINSGTPVLFAGGSRDSLFTLALYEAAGGRLVDENQRPHLDEATLAALFAFYRDAAAAGVFSAESLGIESADEVYARFITGQADLGISWVSNQLKEVDSTTSVSSLPTVTNVPYALVNGWMWTLSNPVPARLGLAEELADFLTTPEFVSTWTAAAGYLPPRADALSAWPDSPETSLASRLVLSANSMPPLSVVDKAGPILQQMLAAVIAGDMTPAEAAAAAASRVNAP